VFCGNSLRLVDDLLFVSERKCPPTAIGAIDNKVVVTTHDAREKERLNALRFEFAGQFHGRGQIGLVETCQSHRFAGLGRSESGQVQRTLQVYSHGIHDARILVDADLSRSAESRLPGRDLFARSRVGRRKVTARIPTAAKRPP